MKVEAASLNPIDWKIQNGVMRPIVPAKFPYVPGTITQFDQRTCYGCFSLIFGLFLVGHPYQECGVADAVIPIIMWINVIYEKIEKANLK